MSDNDPIVLRGLNAANPLAFLAALGVLKTLSKRGDRVWLHWVIRDEKWTPCVTGVDEPAERLAAVLFELLPADLGSPWTADKRLPFASERLRTMLRDGLRDSVDLDREVLDLLTSFGCEAFFDEKGAFEDSALRMVRSGDSAGQGFLDYACKIAKATTVDDLAACLFGDRWVYADRGSSLRWDPSENREYALLAGNPSDDGALSVIGANRLAIEALPLFPTQPQVGGLATTGFFQPRDAPEREFRWPVWTTKASLNVVRSLLVMPELHREQVDRGRMVAVGIQAAFASRQVRPNQYYRNFSPARSLL
jgi:hypothetical protein